MQNIGAPIKSRCERNDWPCRVVFDVEAVQASGDHRHGRPVRVHEPGLRQAAVPNERGAVKVERHLAGRDGCGARYLCGVDPRASAPRHGDDIKA